jgi:hypothetical protein
MVSRFIQISEEIQGVQAEMHSTPPPPKYKIRFTAPIVTKLNILDNFFLRAPIPNFMNIRPMV